MSIFFTSDHHFGHERIIELTGRPFKDRFEMNRAMKERWNERIKPNDLVYIVGDLSFMQETATRKLCKELNGKKMLIQGNHDKDKRLPKDCFEEICFNKEIEINGEKVLMCHYPYKGTPEEIAHAEKNGYKLKYMDRRPEDNGGWLIHGHVHQKWKIKRKMINVSVEPWDYYPVSMEEIVQIIEGKYGTRFGQIPQSDTPEEERGL